MTNVDGPGQPGFPFTEAQSDPISCTDVQPAPAGPASIQVDKRWVINGVEYDNGEQPDDFQAKLEITGPGGDPATRRPGASEREGYAQNNDPDLRRDRDVPAGGLCAGSRHRMVAGQQVPPAYTASLHRHPGRG